MRVYFPPVVQQGEKPNDKQAYRPVNSQWVRVVVAIIDGMNIKSRKREVEHRI